jgi:hypothetical protein
MINIIHSYVDPYTYLMMNIWILTKFLLHWYLRLVRRCWRESNYNPVWIVRGTVHLFVGMGRNPGENAFMTLICIHNRNINHQGWTDLFLFSPTSYLTFVATLNQSCRLSAIASTFVVIVFRQCLRLNDLRRGKRYSSRSFSYDKGPTIFDNTLETKG